jgi:hypothetical protein
MKDMFLISFAPLIAVAPVKPASSWLDFIEQCHQLARSYGPGEYWVCSESDPTKTHKFWV